MLTYYRTEHKTVTPDDCISSQLLDNPCYTQVEHLGSSKYSQVSTQKIVELIKEQTGYVVTSWQQARVKGDNGFQAHMLRMRKPYQIDTERAPELCLTNAHNTLKSFSLHLGYIEFACLNGLMVGSMIDQFKSRHINFDYAGLESYLHSLPRLIEHAQRQITAMQARTLEGYEIAAFTMKAMQLRGFDERLQTYVSKYESVNPDHIKAIMSHAVERFQAPKRQSDTKNDIFTVFNRVQEHAIHGVKRSRHVLANFKPLTSISEQTTVNKQLWDNAMQLTA